MEAHTTTVMNKRKNTFSSVETSKFHWIINQTIVLKNNEFLISPPFTIKCCDAETSWRLVLTKTDPNLPMVSFYFERLDDLTTVEFINIQYTLLIHSDAKKDCEVTGNFSYYPPKRTSGTREFFDMKTITMDSNDIYIYCKLTFFWNLNAYADHFNNPHLLKLLYDIKQLVTQNQFYDCCLHNVDSRQKIHRCLAVARLGFNNHEVLNSHEIQTFLSKEALIKLKEIIYPFRVLRIPNSVKLELTRFAKEFNFLGLYNKLRDNPHKSVFYSDSVTDLVIVHYDLKSISSWNFECHSMIYPLPNLSTLDLIITFKSSNTKKKFLEISVELSRYIGGEVDCSTVFVYVEMNILDEGGLVTSGTLRESAAFFHHINILRIEPFVTENTFANTQTKPCTLKMTVQLKRLCNNSRKEECTHRLSILSKCFNDTVSFSEDMLRLFERPYLFDVNFYYRGCFLQLHRIILWARCPFFRKRLPMLDSEIIEMDISNIMDVNPEDVNVAIKYIYCGRIIFRVPTQNSRLAVVAHFFELPLLRKAYDDMGIS